MYKDDEYIRQVNATYSKSFSPRQILPQFILQKYLFLKSTMSVLDYGAGKDIYGTKILRDSGKFSNVVAYDIGKNCIDGVHCRTALSQKYDIIMMSNVVNVQPSVPCITSMLIEAFNCMGSCALLYCNLPKSPRKCDIDEDTLLMILRGICGEAHWYGHGDIFEAKNIKGGGYYAKGL